MREFHWSWSDLEATPAYVVRYSWDFLNAVRAAENEEADRTQRRNERAAAGG